MIKSVTGKVANLGNSITYKVPIELPPEQYEGVEVYGEDGQVWVSDGETWRVVMPSGAEVILPYWIQTPEGWFDTKVNVGIAGRRIISNRFELEYVIEDLVSWITIRPEFLKQYKDGTVVVEDEGDPIGYIEDVSNNGVNWFSPSSSPTKTLTANFQTDDYDVYQPRPSFTMEGRTGMSFYNTDNDTTKTPNCIGFDAPYEFTGTMIICSDWGSYWLNVTIGKGLYEYQKPESWNMERMNIEEVMVFDVLLSESERMEIINHLTKRDYPRKPFMGRIGDYTTTLEGQWAERREIIEFPKLNFGGVEDMTLAFANTNAGSWITSDLLETAVDVTTFHQTFESAEVVEIPRGFFDNCPNVTRFISTFENNDITEVPEGLFDNQTLVKNFEDCFQKNKITSVPAGLFDTNANVTRFQEVFDQNEIVDVPEGLFDAQTQCTNYNKAFSNNKLSQASVNNILLSVLASAEANNLDNGVLGINGGTNATPSSVGQSAATSLRNRGWEVNLNGF